MPASCRSPSRPPPRGSPSVRRSRMRDRSSSRRRARSSSRSRRKRRSSSRRTSKRTRTRSREKRRRSRSRRRSYVDGSRYSSPRSRSHEERRNNKNRKKRDSDMDVESIGTPSASVLRQVGRNRSVSAIRMVQQSLRRSASANGRLIQRKENGLFSQQSLSAWGAKGLMWTQDTHPWLKQVAEGNSPDLVIDEVLSAAFLIFETGLVTDNRFQHWFNEIPEVYQNVTLKPPTDNLNPVSIAALPDGREKTVRYQTLNRLKIQRIYPLCTEKDKEKLKPGADSTVDEGVILIVTPVEKKAFFDLKRSTNYNLDKASRGSLVLWIKANLPDKYKRYSKTDSASEKDKNVGLLVQQLLEKIGKSNSSSSYSSDLPKKVDKVDLTLSPDDQSKSKEDENLGLNISDLIASLVDGTHDNRIELPESVADFVLEDMRKIVLKSKINFPLKVKLNDVYDAIGPSRRDGDSTIEARKNLTAHLKQVVASVAPKESERMLQDICKLMNISYSKALINKLIELIAHIHALLPNAIDNGLQINIALKFLRSFFTYCFWILARMYELRRDFAFDWFEVSMDIYDAIVPIFILFLKYSSFDFHIKIWHILDRSSNLVVADNKLALMSSNVLYLICSPFANEFYFGLTLRRSFVRRAEHYRNVLRFTDPFCLPIYQIWRGVDPLGSQNMLFRISSFIFIPFIQCNRSPYQLSILEDDYITAFQSSMNVPQANSHSLVRKGNSWQSGELVTTHRTKHRSLVKFRRFAKMPKAFIKPRKKGRTTHVLIWTTIIK